MDEALRLNELKSLILLKLEIRAITPGDCKRISIEISKNLNKHISETTIKRLFGFAAAKHNFSRFTLTTLFEYVDKIHLMEPVVIEKEQVIETSLSRTDLHENASRITDYTLKGIRNRSGLPYDMTISRKFAEHDFQDFFKSEFRFTCFIAQPGYGKTILLSHLVESAFQGDDPGYPNSTVLFTNIYNIFTEERAFNLEDKLKEQLEIPVKENLVQHINQRYREKDEKFVIVLDGFGEVVLKRDLKDQLFDSIINFLCALEDSTAIKVVMSMRCTTWTRFYERMRHSAYLRTAWFQGNYFNLNDLSNVPPLTTREVDLIISKMTIMDVREINPKLKAQLKFPFHIQLYYQLNEEDPNFNYYSNLSFYELISRFIQEKIYRSNYYTEKILFLKTVIQLTDYGKKGNSVVKNELLNNLAMFKNAYMELLADGILMEERRFENSHPKEFVRFVHPHIFEYFLFVEILEKFNLRVNDKFFEYIKTEYDSNQVCFILLQWAIRFIIKTGDFSTATCIFNLGLDNYSKNYLILFIAENIKYRASSSSETLVLLKEHQLHQAIVKELITFDFIDACYKEAICVLIEICDTDEHALIYHSILALPDLFSLDQKRIKTRLGHLGQYKSLSASWIIDPLATVQLLSSKIENKNADSMDVLNQIELLKHGEVKPERSASPDTKTAVGYLLALTLNLFYGDQTEAITLIKAISERYPDFYYRRSPFAIYILNLLGIAGARTQSCSKNDQIEQILLRISADKRFTFTKYSETLLLIMQANQSKNRREYEKALEYVEECISIYKKTELTINCLLAFNLIIGIYKQLNDISKVNEYKYERLCFLEEKDIAGHLFPLPKEVMN